MDSTNICIENDLKLEIIITEIKSTESVHKIRYRQSHILTCLVVSNDNFVGQGFLNKRFYTSGEPLVFNLNKEIFSYAKL